MGESKVMERQSLCHGGMYYLSEERGCIFVSDTHESCSVFYM